MSVRRIQVRKSVYRGEQGFTLSGSCGAHTGLRMFFTDKGAAQRHAQIIRDRGCQCLSPTDWGTA